MYIVWQSGYGQRQHNMLSVVTGQYNKNRLIYKGYVTCSSRKNFSRIKAIEEIAQSSFDGLVPSGNEEAR